MKTILQIITLYLINISLVAGYYDFSGKDLEKAKASAIKQSKQIIYIYSTWNCGPCREMEKNVLKNETWENFKKSFVVVKLTNAKEAEKAGLAEHLTGTPAYLLTQNDGEIISKFGYESKIAGEEKEQRILRFTEKIHASSKCSFRIREIYQDDSDYCKKSRERIKIENERNSLLIEQRKKMFAGFEAYLNSEESKVCNQRLIQLENKINLLSQEMEDILLQIIDKDKK
jgi:thioredoxin-related protein